MEKFPTVSLVSWECDHQVGEQTDVHTFLGVSQLAKKFVPPSDVYLLERMPSYKAGNAQMMCMLDNN
jgi:hypothetical protein